MAKKHWIYIKRGLSEDPKHRAQMGECIWLYMHIIDRADWETGIARDWKDNEEAAEMSMPVDTLRRQRQKLENMDYIRCFQRQHSQDIFIMEWRNPRDYGSEVKNPRIQGSHEPPPSETGQGSNGQPPSGIEGLNQGLNEGLNQGQAQVKTPTSDSIPESSSDGNSQVNPNTGRRTSAKVKGNLVDGMVAFGKQAQEQGAEQVEELLQELDRRLKVNIDRSLANQEIAKRILRDGRPIDTWLAWVYAEEWRAAHTYLYADMARIWRDWPQAFPSVGEPKAVEPQRPDTPFTRASENWEPYERKTYAEILAERNSSEHLTNNND